MMKKFKISIRLTVFFAFFALVIFTGCTGPKGMAPNHGSHQTWDSIPYQKDLSVKVKAYLVKDASYSWDGKNAGDLFKEILIEKLERQKLFSKVTAISDTETANTALLLEINMELLTDWDSRARLRNQEHCEVGIAGRLVDVKNDKVILTLAEGRAGFGGILGMGGRMHVASAKRLLKQLMEWVAEDITEVLEKEMSK